MNNSESHNGSPSPRLSQSSSSNGLNIDTKLSNESLPPIHNSEPHIPPPESRLSESAEGSLNMDTKLSNEAAAEIPISESHNFTTPPECPLSKSILDDLKKMKAYSYSDLTTATNKFAEMNKLGEGTYAVVYKAELSGETLAVKKFKSSLENLSEKSIKGELYVLDYLDHCNLVKLIGCSYDSEVPDLLFVYEYVPAKTLNHYLFDTVRPLSWPLKLEIAKGIAKGLERLHSRGKQSKQSLIHRDIKPGNIIMSEQMKPKIGDFGLARLIDDKKTMETPSRGTPVYMAPECRSGKFSKKSDVYSFGLVLLQIVTGVTLWNEKRKSDMLKKFRMLMAKNRIAEVVGRKLLLKGVEMIQAKSLLDLALRCCEDVPEQRPQMKEVSKLLGSLPSQPKVPEQESQGRACSGASQYCATGTSTTSHQPTSLPKSRTSGKTQRGTSKKDRPKKLQCQTCKKELSGGTLSPHRPAVGTECTACRSKRCANAKNTRRKTPKPAHQRDRSSRRNNTKSNGTSGDSDTEVPVKGSKELKSNGPVLVEGLPTIEE